MFSVNEGLRIVMLTVPASQAGGMMTCTRSPVGSRPDRMGWSFVIFLSVGRGNECCQVKA